MTLSLQKKSAQGGTRTRRPRGIRTSSVRVCQFRHLGVVEVRVGVEPTHDGFADRPLNHLGTAPKIGNNEKDSSKLRGYGWEAESGVSSTAGRGGVGGFRISFTLAPNWLDISDFSINAMPGSNIPRRAITSCVYPDI